MTIYNIYMYYELKIFHFKYILKTHQTYLLIFKIHQSYRLSVYKSGNVLQPAKSAFIADSPLISNAPANHTHEYCHRLFKHSHTNECRTAL